MTDLRKAAEMALEGFKIIHKGCGAVKEEAQFRDDKDVRDLATEIRKICNKYSKSLRQALAQPEWVGLTDEEIEKCKIDGGLPHTVNWRLSAKIMQAKLKEKNT